MLVDAAQTLGHVPIDVDAQPIDLLASSGHKGLLGPLGTGFLYLRPGVEDELDSVRQGGTGSQSEQDVQPAVLPDKYESGNLNVLGIAGLAAGVSFVAEQGVAALSQQIGALADRLCDGLREVDGVTLFRGEEPVAFVMAYGGGTLGSVHPQSIGPTGQSFHTRGMAIGLVMDCFTRTLSIMTCTQSSTQGVSMAESDWYKSMNSVIIYVVGND